MKVINSKSIWTLKHELQKWLNDELHYKTDGVRNYVPLSNVWHTLAV